MLVVSRKEGEAVNLAGGIRIEVVRVSGNKSVRIGIKAPPEIEVYRDELQPREGGDVIHLTEQRLLEIVGKVVEAKPESPAAAIASLAREIATLCDERTNLQPLFNLIDTMSANCGKPNV